MDLESTTLPVWKPANIDPETDQFLYHIIENNMLDGVLFLSDTDGWRLVNLPNGDSWLVEKKMLTYHVYGPDECTSDDASKEISQRGGFTTEGVENVNDCDSQLPPVKETSCHGLESEDESEPSQCQSVRIAIKSVPLNTSTEKISEQSGQDDEQVCVEANASFQFLKDPHAADNLLIQRKSSRSVDSEDNKVPIIKDQLKDTASLNLTKDDREAKDEQTNIKDKFKGNFKLTQPLLRSATHSINENFGIRGMVNMFAQMKRKNTASSKCLTKFGTKQYERKNPVRAQPKRGCAVFSEKEFAPAEYKETDKIGPEKKNDWIKGFKIPKVTRQEATVNLNNPLNQDFSHARIYSRPQPSIVSTSSTPNLPALPLRPISKESVVQQTINPQAERKRKRSKDLVCERGVTTRSEEFKNFQERFNKSLNKWTSDLAIEGELAPKPPHVAVIQSDDESSHSDWSPKLKRSKAKPLCSDDSDEGTNLTLGIIDDMLEPTTSVTLPTSKKQAKGRRRKDKTILEQPTKEYSPSKLQVRTQAPTSALRDKTDGGREEESQMSANVQASRQRGPLRSPAESERRGMVGQSTQPSKEKDDEPEAMQRQQKRAISVDGVGPKLKSPRGRGRPRGTKGGREPILKEGRWVFVCNEPNCEQSFPKLGNCERHEKEVHGNQMIFYMCSKCGKEIKREQDVKRHIKKQHQGNADYSPVVSAPSAQ